MRTAPADTNTTLRKLVVVGVVVAAHVIALSVMQAASVQRPAAQVIVVQMISQPAAPRPTSVATARTLPQGSRSSVAKPAVDSTAQRTAVVPDNPPVTATQVGAQAVPLAVPVTESTALAASLPGATAAMPTGAATDAAVANRKSSNRLELPSSDADYLHNPKPEYPRLSRQRNEQGKVVVNVFIGVDGLAQKAEVKVSSGFERLDAVALSTAKSWRYVPGKRGGVPEAMWFDVPISFVME